MINDRITLTLYDDFDKPAKTLSRSSVRWKVLKKVVKMTAEGGRDNSELDQFDMMLEIVADVFAGQATAEEIEAGASFTDIMTCIQKIAELAEKEKNANFRQGARR